MITTGSKFFFGLAGLAIVAAVVWGWGTDGGLLGAASLGLRGGAGELSGYTVLLFVAICALGLGVASSAFRDADPEAAAEVARLEAVPPATPPAGLSYWPVVAAFGAVVSAIGLVVGAALFVAGLFIVGIAIVEWMVLAWADRATGDPAVNQQIRNRLMYPFEVPLAGAIVVGGIVFSFSRVFLTLSKNGASAVAIVIAVGILVIGFLVSYRPKVSSNVLAGFLVIVALGVLAGGIVAAERGARHFEHHDSGEHSELAPHDEESEG